MNCAPFFLLFTYALKKQKKSKTTPFRFIHTYKCVRALMQLLICKHFFTQPQLKSKTAWTLSKNWHSAPMFETHQIKKATTSFVSFLYSTKILWMNKASKHCKDTKQMRMSAFQNWCIAHKSAKQQPSERVHIILTSKLRKRKQMKASQQKHQYLLSAAV
jgi:hypothetical protein